MAAGAVTPGDPSGEVMMQLELQMTQVSDTTYGATDVNSGCERSRKEERHPHQLRAECYHVHCQGGGDS